MFVRFNPPQSTDAEEGSVQLSKLGQWLPATVNLTVDGGSKILHGVDDEGIRFVSKGKGASATDAKLDVKMFDAGVVCLVRFTLSSGATGIRSASPSATFEQTFRHRPCRASLQGFR